VSASSHAPKHWYLGCIFNSLINLMTCDICAQVDDNRITGIMLRADANLLRPEPWLPYVFTSIDDPRMDEIVPQNRP